MDTVPDELTSKRTDLNFVGLVGMIDHSTLEVRAGRDRVNMPAGVRPVMITGDHKLTWRLPGAGCFPHDGHLAT